MPIGTRTGKHTNAEDIRGIPPGSARRALKDSVWQQKREDDEGDDPLRAWGAECIGVQKRMQGKVQRKVDPLHTDTWPANGTNFA